MSKSEQSTDAANPEDLFGDLKKNWGWILALGILLLILGTIGLCMTLFVTLASVFSIGVLLLVGGGAQIVHAFKAKGWKSIVLSVLIAILYIVSGIVVIGNPVAASAVLTLMLAGAIIGIGVLRTVMGIHLRGFKNWIWPVLSGIIAILMGAVIILQWPISGFWVIGLFVAVEMIMNGWATIAIAVTAKNVGLKPEH
ncbi:MAG TPA: HdeD family acid-resistance protein [Bacteroidota bacterium]|nr:HdeD family acid-resistance protein [Bacteroidota bacterium]